MTLPDLAAPATSAAEPPYDPELDGPPPEDPTPAVNGHQPAEIPTWEADRPPQDIAAEKALLGALLAYPEQATHAATLLDGPDFYLAKHETIWDSIHAVAATGALPEPTLVLDHLRRTGNFRRTILDGPYLSSLLDAGTHGQVDSYARLILEAAQLRVAQTGANRILHAIKSGRRDNVATTLGHIVDTLDNTVGRFGSRTIQHSRRIETIDELLAGEEDDTYDWVIPDLLERQERVILTAEEGAGKSTLLRQIAIQAAAGIHPFTGQPMTPITVLHIDVENTRRQSRRRYRPLRIQAGPKLDPQRLRIELNTAGIDLTTTSDRDWLTATCQHVQPDLLILGPIYKLANGDPTEEKSAKPVAMAIDTIRDATDCAVLLEAHAAKAPTGQRRRPHEPYGWSGWLRWPEIGLWLDKTGELTPWRGAREERSWPEKLDRGGDWPWSPAITELAEQWNEIRIARQAENEPMSFAAIATATGKSKTTISRLIGNNAPYAYAWRLLNQDKNTHPDEPEDNE
jgi:hypothetical protein